MTWQKTRRDQGPQSSVLSELHGNTSTWCSPAQAGPSARLSSQSQHLPSQWASAGATDRGSECAARLGFCLRPDATREELPLRRGPMETEMHPSPHTLAGRRKA